MTYQIALFVHLMALLAATAASAIVHFAAARRAAAATLRDSMEWSRLMGATARVFPVAVLTLVATGAYMVAGRWGWSEGWIKAGFLGAFVLLASGAIMGKRGAAEARRNIQRLQSATHELRNDRSTDRLAAVLSDANTGLALAIALVMTIKPGFAASLGVLAIGAAAGTYRALSGVRAGDSISDTSEFEAA